MILHSRARRAARAPLRRRPRRVACCRWCAGGVFWRGGVCVWGSTYVFWNMRVVSGRRRENVQDGRGGKGERGAGSAEGVAGPTRGALGQKKRNVWREGCKRIIEGRVYVCGVWYWSGRGGRAMYGEGEQKRAEAFTPRRPRLLTTTTTTATQQSGWPRQSQSPSTNSARRRLHGQGRAAAPRA